jgi:hypothetical protein
MRHTHQSLRAVIDRTDGYCHICGKKVFIRHHGARGKRGAWEVDHSRPRACGGSDHLNNLLAACVRCNRDKRDYTTRTARAWLGTSTRMPLSRAAKARHRADNEAAGAVLGGVIGLVGGPVGALVGALIGSAVGKSAKPPRY